MTVHVRRGGPDGPALVLLHGLGATGDVWRAVADAWPGRWVVPDLPGHGRSAPLPEYTYDSLATALAPVVPTDRPVVVLGHSLGGVLALALGSGSYGPSAGAVCGLGVKVRWTGQELAKAAELADRPVKVFATRDEAAERALKVAGLWQLVAADSPLVDDALVESADGWRLALDPRAYAVGAPDMTALITASKARVVLAAGARDPMCPPEHLFAVAVDSVVLPGLGHNAHVEKPDALAPLLARLRACLGG
ncbi:alpha/beta fold hydrolase [Umezawaea tangerina]|uniref:Pimeloyl-ACP methyl ester carboxylesterase n=1 Tax=Umezawaea tangerina TaxID=84725 RepID=A0A2T0TLR9_9PSEU|nr:alpha/beta hydrolase [Umezawaea tangerina]PRY46664.1 pimeloyl-ACP methyl ester carboxylesterase [Umezawaea tangerina]